MAIATTRRSSSKKKTSALCREALDSYPQYRDFGQNPFGNVYKVYARSSEDSHHQEDASGRSRGGKKSTFPKMLYQMVNDAEDRNYTDVIAWMPHGRSFAIKDKDRFTNEILPMHFGSQNSFASFQRQLNVYGFLRMTKNGPDRKSYYHELFLRGRQDLIPLIPRRRKTTARVRRSLDPMTEPNLYAFSPCIQGYCCSKAFTIPDEMVSSSSLSPEPLLPDFPEEAPSSVDAAVSVTPQFSFNPSPDVAVSFHQGAPGLTLSGEESSSTSSIEETITVSPVHGCDSVNDNACTDFWQSQLMAGKPCAKSGSFREEEYHIVAHPEDVGFMASFQDEDMVLDEDMELDRF